MVHRHDKPLRTSRMSLLAAFVFVAALADLTAKARADTTSQPPTIDLRAALLRDPASPVAGNPAGDVTVVVFADYNCPYCRKSDGDLEALIAADPKVRIVYKDWPILAKSSVAAAKVAIAANWQGKYAEVHQALMRMIARPATEQDISQAVLASGIDVSRLNRDLESRDGDIVALLKRNIAEADALGLQGTPVYIIGPFLEARPLNASDFKQIVADARKAGANPAADTR